MSSTPDRAVYNTLHLADHSAAHTVVQAGRIDTLNLPPAVPAPAFPLRLGDVPQLATAFQPRSAVREALAAAGTTVVLAGGGGVGKSQLAAQHAHRALADGTDLVLWVNATDPAAVATACTAAALAVRAPGATGQPEDAEQDAACFRNWLATTDRSWLVVLDDVTDFAAVAWPSPARHGRGQVLATTRRRGPEASSQGRTLVDVDVYTEDEAHEFLGRRLAAAGRSHLLDEQAAELLAELGRLPLALGHAAAYLIHRNAPCARYLALFRDRDRTLDALLPPRADTERYGRTVTTALLIALDAAQQEEPAGLALPALRLAALLDPAGHPHELWTTPVLTGYLGPDAEDALALLHNYHLVTDAGTGPRAVTLHNLTARAVLDTTPQEDRPYPAAADALAELWPAEVHLERELAATLRANANVLLGRAGDRLWRDGCHSVVHRIGESLHADGLYRAMAEFWEQQVATSTRLLGAEHLETFVVSNSLAAAYREAGRLPDALALLEHLAPRAVRVLGADHRESLTTRGSLALSLRLAGRTEESVALGEAVLIDLRTALGPEHPQVLVVMNNLAGAYRDAERTDEAVAVEEQALDILTRLRGADHPNTLTVRGNLLISYRRTGRTEEAIALGEVLVGDMTRVHGAEHPDTLSAKNNLATCYWQADRLTEAGDLLEQVATARVSLLGPDHPNTLTTQNNLASVYQAAGRAAEATELLERTSAQRTRLLGPGHPATLRTLISLANVYLGAGRAADTIALLEQVIADGPAGHPVVLDSHGWLALLLAERGLSRLAEDPAGAARDARRAVDLVLPLADAHPEILDAVRQQVRFLATLPDQAP
ncbi:tetratricopeptide repeat protein [Kitasatospora sp. NPDC058965]|uniref:tetratricopeptide repeat protein n=1 Tax=Kitasatospora sp. NPDC058965 TaxID=3346682 RepID=UPI0036A4B541